MSDQLPEGWTEVRLGDVCEPVSQRGPGVECETFRYIDLGAIDNKSKRIAEASIVPTSAAPSRAKQIVRDGDIVFSTVRVYLENIAEVPADLDGAIASTAFCVLRPAPGIASRYLYHYVTSRPFVLAVNQLQRGNSPPSVQDGDIRSQLLPLAPPREQKRIASRIDELFSRIEEGECALERVQKLVERYRQSVLKAAVKGELTRDWRENNKNQIESGEVLLARILKARRDAWEKAELGKMKAEGTNLANDKWKQKYKAPTSPDIADLPKLPEGWVWASLDQFAAPVERAIQSGPFGSNLLHSEFQDTGRLVIGIDNVREGWFSPGAQNRISGKKFEELQKYAARPKDFLITVMATIGRTCVVPEDIEPAIITKHVYRFTLDQDLVLPEFVNLCVMGSPAVRSQIFGKVQGQTRPGLNKSILIRLGFPLPSIEEQRQILDRSTELLSQIEPFREGLDSLVRLSGSLRQAVLRSAFRGDLVPHDLHDEPASSLLKRIAVERGATMTKSKRAPSKKSEETA